MGSSNWLVVDQARIGSFAYSTLDHQWIHVDTEAAVVGPLGTTVAHGFPHAEPSSVLCLGGFRLGAPGARLN